MKFPFIRRSKHEMHVNLLNSRLKRQKELNIKEVKVVSRSAREEERAIVIKAILNANFTITSDEMDREKIVEWLLSFVSGISANNIRKGLLSNAEYKKVADACSQLSETMIKVG